MPDTNLSTQARPVVHRGKIHDTFTHSPTPSEETLLQIYGPPKSKDK